jgi:hypothetical protein
MCVLFDKLEILRKFLFTELNKFILWGQSVVLIELPEADQVQTILVVLGFVMLRQLDKVWEDDVSYEFTCDLFWVLRNLLFESLFLFVDYGKSLDILPQDVQNIVIIVINIFYFPKLSGCLRNITIIGWNNMKARCVVKFDQLIEDLIKDVLIHNYLAWEFWYPELAFLEVFTNW